MSSPIASPQNVIATIALTGVSRGETSISFGEWLQLSIPFCAVATLCCWAFICLYFGSSLPAAIKPFGKQRGREGDAGGGGGGGGGGDSAGSRAAAAGDGVGSYGMHPSRGAPQSLDDSTTSLLLSDAFDVDVVGVGGEAQEAPMVSERRCIPGVGERGRESRCHGVTVADVVICVTVLLTVSMWVTFDSVKHIFGNIGIVALVPIIIFGSLGYLTQADFNSLSWDTIVLMGGGLSLGTAVESSGLLATVGGQMASFTETSSPYVVLLVFTALVAVLANFISSTVAAALLFPVVASVGEQTGHPKMLTVLCALMTSGAMGLPVSSFPNANAKAQLDNTMTSSWVSNGDFIRTGFPMCLIIYVLVNSLGYGLAKLYGW